MLDVARGVNYKKVGKLYKGDYVDVFAKVGNWYIIKTDDDLVGAVSSDYIEAVLDESERYSESSRNTETETKEGEIGQTEESTNTRS